MGGCKSGYEDLQRCRSPLPFGIGLPGGGRFVPGVARLSCPQQFWTVRTLSGQCDQRGRGGAADFVCRPSSLRELPCRSEEHTSELQSLRHIVCSILLEKNNVTNTYEEQIEVDNEKKIQNCSSLKR